MSALRKLLKRKEKQQPTHDQLLTPPKLPDGARVYAIGDLHGRLDLLTKLLKKIRKDMSKSVEYTELVFLGDYVDRGESSAQLIDFLLSEKLPGDGHVFLRGNHEDVMMNFMAGMPRTESWLNFGGIETLESYGIDATKILKNEGSAVPKLQKALKKTMPDPHLRFFNRLDFHHSHGDYLFVHAGVRPQVPLAAQSIDDFIWIREDFLNHDAPLERFVVHGHTITDGPDIRKNRIGIDTGAYRTDVLTALVLEGKTQRFLDTA